MPWSVKKIIKSDGHESETYDQNLTRNVVVVLFKSFGDDASIFVFQQRFQISKHFPDPFQASPQKDKEINFLINI